MTNLQLQDISSHVFDIPELVIYEKEMGGCNSILDWNRTPVGLPAQWSQNTIDVIFANQLPMVLWWGTGLINFYNDSQTPMQVHPDDLEEAHNKWKQSIETGNDFEIKLRCLNKSSEYQWYISRAKAIKENGTIKMWVGTTTNIEKTKNEEKRKQDFLKMISHELRTPITSIKGHAQLLLSMLKKEHELLLAPLPIRSSLIRIDKLVSRLNRQITAMLDLSRLEAGKLELQKKTFNLNDLIDDAVEDILYSNPTQIINIVHEFSCVIYADRDRIEQVIINLVNNAIKYSSDSDKIEIRIFETEEKHVAVSVKDFGIGIDKNHQENIFECFYRVDVKCQETYSGFGTGLFIANEIVKQHHGIITVESEKDKGAVFTINIPCTSEDTASIKVLF